MHADPGVAVENETTVGFVLSPPFGVNLVDTPGRLGALKSIVTMNQMGMFHFGGVEAGGTRFVRVKLLVVDGPPL